MIFKWKRSKEYLAVPVKFKVVEFGVGIYTYSFGDELEASQCLMTNDSHSNHTLFPEFSGTPPWISNTDPNVTWYAFRFSNCINPSRVTNVHPGQHKYDFGAPCILVETDLPLDEK
jgi:hypothetical protein